jgi:single-strand DNA-binding protein
MASLNKVILIGNMVSDPECKSTPNGISVCRFRVAVQRKFAKEGQQTADFLDIVAWKNTAEFVSKYFKKGNPILVCGQIQSRNWEDKDGGKRYTVEILADEVSFVASKENNESSPTYMPDAYKQPNFEEVANDENLPF